MAYKLNEQRITPGGLDLLVPADQNPRRAALTDLINVPQGECLDLTDWFAGADGHLEQAASLSLVGTPTGGAGGLVTRALLATAGRIYYSDGLYLRQIGRAGEAPIDSGYDGFNVGAIAFQAFAWFMGGSRSSRDDGTTLTTWWEAPPAGPPTCVDLGNVSGVGVNGGSASHAPQSASLYYVTWVTPVGETNPSPWGQVVAGSLTLPSAFQIDQPASPPASATGWNIYREVAPDPSSLYPSGTDYLLNPSPIPIATTSYIDTGDPRDDQDDTSLLLDGVIMQADRDAPPAANVVANQVYNGRIVVANSAANPNRLWFTDPLEPAFFPGSADAIGGNWVDIGTDSDDGILAIMVRPGLLTIYRQKSIWVHLGDCGSPSAIIEVAVPEYGAVGPNAVCSTSASDYFIWVDGVYGFNNDAAGKASFKVDPIFRGLTTENFPPLESYDMSQCALGHRNGRLYVSYSNSVTGFTTLILHLPTGRWFAGSFGWNVFLDAGTGLLAGGAWPADGSGPDIGVYWLEHAYNSSAALAFQSQYHDCGLPDREKTWADLVLTHNTQGATLTIICRTNKNGGVYGSTPPATDSFTLATFTSSALTKQIFPLVYPSTYTTVALRGKPIKSFNLSVRITGPGASGAPAVIESPILLHYYLEARLGMTFDSGITNHGLEGVGRIDQIEIDCDASLGAATLTVSSDIPGGVIGAVTAVSNTIAQTTGRQVIRWVITPAIAGRLFRHQIATTYGIQIYGYKVRILPIGVYADGSQSDFWYTLPLAPGEESGGQ